MTEYEEKKLNKFNDQFKDLLFSDMEKEESFPTQHGYIFRENYIHVPTNKSYKYNIECNHWYEFNEAGKKEMREIEFNVINKNYIIWYKNIFNDQYPELSFDDMEKIGGDEFAIWYTHLPTKKKYKFINHNKLWYDGNEKVVIHPFDYR
jgi:hypothetical protein